MHYNTIQGTINRRQDIFNETRPESVLLDKFKFVQSTPQLPASCKSSSQKEIINTQLVPLMEDSIQAEDNNNVKTNPTISSNKAGNSS